MRSVKRALVALIVTCASTSCGRIGYEPTSVQDASADMPSTGDASADASVDASTDADLADAPDLGEDMGTTTLPGFIVTPTTGLTTSETGSTASFTIRLTTEPTDVVYVVLSSDDESEVTVSPAFVFFGTNWASPQTVTVSGVNDAEADGNQPFTILTASATSEDADYNGVDPADVAGTNLDDETPGIIVSPTDGLTTTESGGSATFTVTLQSAPTSEVTIPIASRDPSEGIATPASVTFTTAAGDWNVPRVVTVSGVDDVLADGDVGYAVEVGPSSSAQPAYNDLRGSDVSITNEDDEMPRLIVSPLSGLTTTELGGTSSFTVLLSSEPTDTVTVSVTSSDVSEGSILPTSLSFTSSNWMIPQTVTATGVDDAVADGDQTYDAIVHVSATSDPNYATASDRHVTIVNIDDESPGINVTPVSGLITSEAGAMATFTITLSSQPTDDVIIALSSDTPAEGTVSPASVTFTSATWNIPQTVTATGVDDIAADGTRLYTIITAPASSGDANYNARDASDVSVSNLDNDTAGVTVVPLSGLVTTEAGGTATFTVVLNVMPTDDVTLTLSSSDSSEGSVAPSMLTFTASNWATPQVVTITGIDDLADDGDVPYTIVTSATSSGSAAYNALPVSDVSVTNTDDDTASVIVTPTSDLVTTEGGGTASFTIVLATQPSVNVSITLSSSNTMEGTVSPASVTFTAMNWATPQTITVTGQNDFLIDGSVAYTIVTGAASSSDTSYNALSVSDVSVTNSDNDVAGVTVTPTAGLITHEANGSTSFTMVLLSQPTANVSISLTSTNTGEGTVSPASITFTVLNWSTPQAVTVTGVNDSVVDGSIAYSVVTGDAVSTDINYSGITVADVAVRNWGVVQQAYIKASNTNAEDRFGSSIAVSSDGSTIAVSANGEASNATGVGGDQTNNSAMSAGAVYIYVRTGLVWTQQAYIKASNAEGGDTFGNSVALSADGSTLAVGAFGEDSNATGIGGNQANNAVGGAGAAYVFTRSGATWTQQAYVKGPNSDGADNFGSSVRLSADGNTMAVAAQSEYSNATGVGGNSANNAATYAGAVFAFTRAGTVWSQQAFIKASNTTAWDYFGRGMALSADGNTLAVGAPYEDSNATGIGGDQMNNSTTDPGAVYVFIRVGAVWSQQAYIKASNTGASDYFGEWVALSADGNTLAASSPRDASDATGIDGDPHNNNATSAGSIHLFTRAGVVWTQQAYIKASNPNAFDTFSVSVLSTDGNTLIVGSPGEDGAGVGLDADQASNALSSAGAVYVFTRSGVTWTQQAYVKSLNAGLNDQFGSAAALSSDNHTLVIGANQEASNATGFNGDQTNNSMMNAGAVYVFQI